jgi:hypothetical protein
VTSNPLFIFAKSQEADLRMKNLKLSPGINNVAGNLNLRAVMLDTQGPEIRTGSFAGGVKEVNMEMGNKVRSIHNVNNTNQKQMKVVEKF